MATTAELQARLAALETAIATGALRVTHDGRTVEYRSLAEMEAVAARLKRQIGTTTRHRRILPYAAKGL
ncbi:phage head-tail joining protein [Minwuia thermotolerans]|uniref:Uncharacterized protein n=1 Tax=Minwuia thermotolerans TaxID=2056226 RepID=A0A2M9G2N5_9PROT|nr:hypothetical protein [Minwuia thermotolerans]PJK29946.1 hypothetical protein CVT23_09260 [Minwuia thermotolerans]